VKWTIATIFVVRMVSGSSHQIVLSTVCVGCVSVQSSATSLETSCFLVLRQQACHCKVRLSTTDSTGCLAHGSSCACILHVSTYCETAAARDGKRLTLQLARWQLNCGSTWLACGGLAAFSAMAPQKFVIGKALPRALAVRFTRLLCVSASR
jgi:hypothetical protein